MSSKLIAGAVTLFIDGQLYASTGEFDVNIQRIEREPILSSSGEVFYSESPMVSEVSGDILLVDGVNPQSLSEASDLTLQIQLRNGHTVLLTDAFSLGSSQLNVKEGTMKVEFKGRGSYV